MIDTHAHLFLCSPSLETLVNNAKTAGVSHIVNVATDIETGFKTLDSAALYPNIIPTIGIHPSETASYNKLADLDDALHKYPFKAVGEMGLDYFKNYAPAEDQKTAFIGQLDLARKHQLPAIIHNRHSDEDMATILKDYPDVKKVLHCFSSNLAFAESILNENTFFSFTGMITEAKKGKVITAIRGLPLSHLMIETDCPYLSPLAYKGQENQPGFVGEVAKKIAEVKGISVEAVQDQTDQTAKAFFGITSP